MAVVKQILDNLSQDMALKMVTQTYSEVAVSKLQRIRGRIEQNRKFVDDIAQLYFLIKSETPNKYKSKPKTKETISLLLTSNYRFYGDLEEQLIKLFVAHTPEFPTDRMVLGKTGVEYLHGIKYVMQFDPINFNKDLPTKEELEALVAKLKEYKRIFVYYPKFKTVLVQSPSFSDITGEPVLNQKDEGRAFYYIFEPEVEKMLSFIEGQIVTLLMEQVVLEAELARTAARLTSMETAQTNADRLIRQGRVEIGRAYRRLAGVRQSEMTITLLARDHSYS